jgi:uncharacterized protein (TIGR03086 family)
MTVADRYHRLAHRFTDLVDALPSDRWEAPSPCEGWSAHDVFDHVVSTEADLLARMPFAPDPLDAAMNLHDKWTAVRDHMQSALNDPATAQHQYDGYFGPTTFGDTVDTFYNGDLVVHTWDIATATSMSNYLAMEPSDIDHELAALQPMTAMMRQPGLFGPELEVAADADQQTRFLAFVGRRA